MLPAKQQPAETSHKEPTMHGTPLTPREAVAAVVRHVRRHEEMGLDRNQAIRRTAADYGMEPHKVRWCVETDVGGASARPAERNYGRIHPALTSAPRRNRKPRRRRGLAGTLAAAALALVSATAQAQASTIQVSAGTGTDTNPGTATPPLKTLAKALSKAKAGDTVKLAAGGYGQGLSGTGNGETV
jgi:hypothetical protein